MKNKNLLTAAEMEIMEILWQNGHPMSSNDILKSGKIEGWSSGYLHNVLRSMLKKEAIRVNGMVQNNTQYARMFEPNLTKEEYAARMAMSVGIDEKSIAHVAVAMARETGSDELIDALEKIIEKLK
ncbi:MAG: BlaI/MecI/CopY family transcriptional regulator [Eubacteriales bacterium]|nr:BlaI/MecI/CopY family transcriptional regulator [Eubacteriales bacterium]